jgi:hypothetical protein
MQLAGDEQEREADDAQRSQSNRQRALQAGGGSRGAKASELGLLPEMLPDLSLTLAGNALSAKGVRSVHDDPSSGRLNVRLGAGLFLPLL